MTIRCRNAYASLVVVPLDDRPLGIGRLARLLDEDGVVEGAVNDPDLSALDSAFAFAGRELDADTGQVLATLPPPRQSVARPVFLSWRIIS